MEDLLGIGKIGNIKSEVKPIICNLNHQPGQVLVGWACSRTNCNLYGICPFSW